MQYALLYSVNPFPSGLFTRVSLGALGVIPLYHYKSTFRWKK